MTLEEMLKVSSWVGIYTARPIPSKENYTPTERGDKHHYDGSEKNVPKWLLSHEVLDVYADCGLNIVVAV